jgi:hypothetical protein
MASSPFDRFFKKLSGSPNTGSAGGSYNPDLDDDDDYDCDCDDDDTDVSIPKSTKKRPAFTMKCSCNKSKGEQCPKCSGQYSEEELREQYECEDEEDEDDD